MYNQSTTDMLNHYQNLINQYNQPLPTNVPQITTEQQIQQMVQKELSKYLPEVKVQEPEKPLTENQRMIKDINDLASAILTPEDLQFISNPEIIKGMPLFLKSSKGREAMALLVSEFRKYVE
jgi:hypothetical protein